MLGLALLMLVALALVIVAFTAAMAWVMVHPPRATFAAALARKLPADPLEAGAPAFETLRVTGEDGVPIEVWDIEAGDPSGPVVVIVHGWSDSRYGALAWYPAVAPAVSRVAVYDLRGHGESWHTRFEWGHAEVDDLVCVLGAMRERHPHRAIVPLGVSMGSMIALDAAAGDEAGPIDAVIADSPFVRPIEVVGRRCRRMGLPHWPMTPLAVAVLALRWPGMWTFDSSERASRLRCPVLVLVGEEDRVSPPSDAERVAGAAPEATLVRFPGAGHCTAATADREAYTRAVRSFLS